MNGLTTPEQTEQAKSAFRAVFAKVNDTDPFDARLASRLLLYPIDYTDLKRHQFEAVARASLQEGVARAYLVGHVSGPDDEKSGWCGTYGHRLVDLHGYDDYTSDRTVLEHFLFSPNGLWVS